MIDFKMVGSSLYDSRHRLIAKTQGESIFDADNRRVGFIRGNILFDPEERKMMSILDGAIYDAGNTKVALLSEVMKAIDGAAEGVISAALWYCFIR